MAYKCRKCSTNGVDTPEDVCELCAIGQGTYASVIRNNICYNLQLQSTYQ